MVVNPFTYLGAYTILRTSVLISRTRTAYAGADQMFHWGWEVVHYTAMCSVLLCLRGVSTSGFLSRDYLEAYRRSVWVAKLKSDTSTPYQTEISGNDLSLSKWWMNWTADRWLLMVCDLPVLPIPFGYGFARRSISSPPIVVNIRQNESWEAWEFGKLLFLFFLTLILVARFLCRG